jgi:hypothetical protein
MNSARSSAEDYAARGTLYQEAWEVLARGCEIPPSLEQFDHELNERRRSNSSLTVVGCARRLADGYHQTKFVVDDG